jgi:hypothetical protein
MPKARKKAIFGENGNGRVGGDHSDEIKEV